MKTKIRTAVLALFVIGLGYLFLGARVRFYKIVSSSMNPTLVVDDRLITVAPGTPERKDIIILRDVENGDYLTKRVIGLPGETILVSQKEVWIDGRKLQEDYIREAPLYALKEEIPEGSYFLLGDNRNESEDSSVWGAVNTEYIVAKAVCVYWPPERFSLLRDK